MENIRTLSRRFKIDNSRYAILVSFALAVVLSSCAKKPSELYKDGMKSFVAGKYDEAQTDFSKGIRRSDQMDILSSDDSLYAGFIAANLVTGKFPQINQSYNDFTNGIHGALVEMFGEAAMKLYGVTAEIIPYKTSGGNRIPADFPQTIVLQAIADHQGFSTIKQQINKVVKQ